MYLMLKLVNIVGMEEIELYLYLMYVKPQVDQLVGTYTDFYLEEILRLMNWTMGISLVAL